jgi:YegS/Rv2252/BmrU family lipid kinase
VAASAGLTGATYFSERPGQIAELVERAASEGAETVVAVGGDGTVNEAVSGLMRLRERGDPTPRLGVLPRGTGTDFVRSFDVPTKAAEAARVIAAGRTRRLDAGRVEYRRWDGGAGIGWFANAASAGMSGAVAQRANATSKAMGGKASFLWATLAVFARWQVSDIEIAADAELRSGRIYDVIVSNCRYLGGGMLMAPEAAPDDGLFDVVVIGDITRTDLALNLPKVYRGTVFPHPKLEQLRAASISVDAARPLPVQLDGEQPGTTPVRFDVVPGAFELHVP